MIAQESDRTTRLLVACGYVAPVITVVTFLVAASRVAGYDHVADTISKLSAEGVSSRWLWTIGLGLYVVLIGLFALGLRRRFGSSRPGRMLSWALAAHAALMGGVAVFQDDLKPGGFFSAEGAVHDVLSGMAFSALVVAMLGVLLLARQVPFRMPLRTATMILGLTMTVVGIVFLFTPPAVQGVPQRVFVGVAAVWIVLLAVSSRGSFRSSE